MLLKSNPRGFDFSLISQVFDFFSNLLLNLISKIKPEEYSIPIRIKDWNWCTFFIFFDYDSLEKSSVECQGFLELVQ